MAKGGRVHYNQRCDYKTSGVARNYAGRGMTGRIIMPPVRVFFRLIITATGVVPLLFSAAVHAGEIGVSPDDSAKIQDAGAAEPSPELAVSPQLPDPLEPGEIIFETKRKKAMETGKESLLNEYLKDTPGNRFAARAREAVDDVRYGRCRAENSIRAYTVYIMNNPASRHAADAARRVDDMLFARVSRENSIEEYMLFMESFPNHPLVPAAEAAVEDLIFDEVKRAESIVAWAEFLRGHAASERVPEALALKDGLEYEPYHKRDVEEGYREFLRGFPVNRHRDEAYSRMMVLRTARVKQETEAICAEATNEGSFSCNFVAFDEGTLLVKITRLSGEEQGQHLLMGGPGYAEEALRRYSAWKNDTIKRLLRILSVISVTVE